MSNQFYVTQMWIRTNLPSGIYLQNHDSIKTYKYIERGRTIV